MNTSAIEQKLIRAIADAIQTLSREAAISVLEAVADHCEAMAEGLTEEMIDDFEDADE